MQARETVLGGTRDREAVDEGVIGRLLVAEGSEGVKVNVPIAVILEEGEDASAVNGAELAAPPAAAPAPRCCESPPACPAAS